MKVVCHRNISLNVNTIGKMWFKGTLKVFRGKNYTKMRRITTNTHVFFPLQLYTLTTSTM